MVQFNHRLMAYLLCLLGAYLWFRGTRQNNEIEVGRNNYHVVLLLLLRQVFLGILALSYSVPITLGFAHQLVAMLLVISVVNLKFELAVNRKFKNQPKY